MDREGPAGREREWRRLIEAERAALENHCRGQLAKLLGGALPGERREELECLAREDRSRAELGLVELRDDGVYYKSTWTTSPRRIFGSGRRPMRPRRRGSWGG